MSKWTKIVNQINSYDDIVILTHTNMDGDAIGSAAALCRALRFLNKRSVVLIEDDIPNYLKFIDNKDGDSYFVKAMPFAPRLAIAVDCGDESRIEKRLDVYKSAELKICIDHHLQQENFSDLSVVESDAAATGMLIYELIIELGVVIDKEISEYLYTAIITDTGLFKFSNTTGKVHEVVSKLYDAGLDHLKICTNIYENYSLGQLRAESLAIEKAELFAGGKAVISHISYDEMKTLGISYEQVETCIDRIRKIEGTEMAAFVKEKEPGLIKVSLRAKTYANVNNVANALGGGGHHMAAGCTLNMGIDEAINSLKQEMIKELDK